MAFSCRILLVERDPDQRALLTEYLSRQSGLTLLPSTGSGMEALARIQTDPPDLLLLDIDAGDLDGLSVLETLAEYGMLSRLSVLILLNRRDDRMASAALAMGARCVLVRPMELSHLLHRIQTFGMAASPLQLRLRWMDLDQEGIKFYQCRLAAEAMAMLDEPHPQLKSIFVQVASQCHTQTGNVAKNVERAVKYAHSRNSPYYRALFGAVEKPPSTYRFLLRLTEGLRNVPTDPESFRP